jgi:uncharacterized membrane protein YkgB
MSQQAIAVRPPILNRSIDIKTVRLHQVARGILHYGLVALLLLWGAMKFTEMEAQAIRPLVEHHPLMSWMYAVFGVRGTSAVIGVVELIAASLMSVRPWSPRLWAAGSALASATFVITVSFLVTTPGVFSPDNPFGGFLLKDIILLGAALHSLAEALDATSKTRQESAHLAVGEKKVVP